MTTEYINNNSNKKAQNKNNRHRNKTKQQEEDVINAGLLAMQFTVFINYKNIF